MRPAILSWTAEPLYHVYLEDHPTWEQYRSSNGDPGALTSSVVTLFLGGPLLFLLGCSRRTYRNLWLLQAHRKKEKWRRGTVWAYYMAVKTACPMLMVWVQVLAPGHTLGHGRWHFNNVVICHLHGERTLSFVSWLTTQVSPGQCGHLEREAGDVTSPWLAGWLAVRPSSISLPLRERIKQHEEARNPLPNLFCDENANLFSKIYYSRMKSSFFEKQFYTQSKLC